MKILFIGETWNGSSARSMRDSLAAIQGVDIDDIGEDQYQPRGRGLVVRSANRILVPFYRRELAEEVFRRLPAFKPQVVIIYKGALLSSTTVRAVRESGIPVINIFPDCSPHAHGRSLREAMGEYDLVVSTKPFHPANWASTYGYRNVCVFVPHGYDPAVHYWPEPSSAQDIDVVLAASWRPQYEALMANVGQLLPDAGVTVALAGPGWAARRAAFPAHWTYPGPLHGRSYGEFVRRGKIVIAPVHTDVSIDGKIQPGDEDSTRTYELAAAGCFFLHRRTAYVQQVYDEQHEVPMWDDAEELTTLIRSYLPMDGQRRTMALAAHKRAVPSYSIPARAGEVLAKLMKIVEDRAHA